MSLRNKALGGVFWTFTQQFSVQIINLLVQIVLARLLMPEAFGVIALLQIFVSIGQILMDSGMTSSLIRTKDADQRDYSTVFFMNLSISIGVYIFLFALSPRIAGFFGQPIITSILRVYALSFVIQALYSVQVTRLTKQMNFKLQMLMQIPSSIIGGVVGISLAFTGFGVWSLVWLNLATTSCLMLQYWIRISWKPSPIVDGKLLRKHFNFGYKLALSSLLTEVYRNSYTFIIGKVYSTTQLGYYNQANTLKMFPVRNLTTALQKVTYPLFSQIQDDDIQLKKVFRRITSVVLYVVVPMMFYLIVVADPLFRLVLTEKWLPAVPYFQVLCISAVFYPLSLYNLNIISAKGRSDLHFRLEIIKKVLASLFLLLIIPYGIWGIVYAQAISLVIHYIVNAYYSGKMINYSLSQQLKDALPVFVIAVLAVIISVCVDRLLVSWVSHLDVLRLIFDFVVFFFTYIALSYIVRVKALKEVKSIFIEIKRKSFKVKKQ
ncbi:lipopolysaccharide biosynthesis protein [Parapedobacter soli]|uniref:lipopolysaccharide biosynthesis protein n=1 Tax=Parapedobacter soli TaxID=416955 RepID=UPI0021C5AD08|nr:lipopolysaccharide biosynthesis protein [Parapedobacter soli]